MKNVKQIVASALVLFVMGTKANAQATTQAIATATIVTPISIAWVDDLEFGNLAVTATGGAVTLNAQTGARSQVGGVTFPVVTGTFNAADFTVSGQGTYTYAITLPSAAVTLTGSVSGTMDATAFTSFPASTGVLGAGGTQTLKVGATLAVAASQAAGTYTSANFDVTVNYN